MKKHIWKKKDVSEFLRGNWLYFIILAGLLLSGVGVQYLARQNSRLFQETQALLDQNTIITAGYSRAYMNLKDTENELARYKKDLEVTKVQRDVIAQNLGQEKVKVEELSGTVDVLEKLTTLDPELLKKYSKVFFLSENYIPTAIFAIPDKYKYFEDRDVSVLADAWPYLQKLLLKAQQDKITLYVLSGYRSFDDQKSLKARYRVTYGAGTANQFSADQGYSEHQLGTTVDFITTGLGGRLNGFENTESYKWLKENAHNFGFTLSYPEKNGSYIFEPWHWRFVGVKLATYLYNKKMDFYDLDQRAIDKYLIYIFD